MNRTPDELIDAMAFAATDKGGSITMLMGDNEIARLVLAWRDRTISHNGHTFTKDDALSLSRWWQDFAHNPKKVGSIAGDNVDSLLDELCYALGATDREIHETWWHKPKYPREP